MEKSGAYRSQGIMELNFVDDERQNGHECNSEANDTTGGGLVGRRAVEDLGVEDLDPEGLKDGVKVEGKPNENGNNEKREGMET